MNIKYHSKCEQPRADVWCMSTELSDNGDGTYSFADATAAAKIGTGSQIVVIDKPGLVLFYDAASALAYDWTPGV